MIRGEQLIHRKSELIQVEGMEKKMFGVPRKDMSI